MHSYQLVFAIFGGCSLLGMMLIALIKVPRRTDASVDTQPRR
jgi:hypothetical protein